MTTKTFQLEALVRENVKVLQPYSSARDEYNSKDADMIFLDANESPYGNGMNRYPDPHQSALKVAIAKVKGVSEEQILLGNGSDEVLDLIFRAFCEPHTDNIITLPPTYGMYKVLAATNAVENREVVLLPNFQPDIASILNTVDEATKLLFLCSPNNPTGNSFDEEQLEALLRGFSGLVVIDEAYIDFSNGNSWLGRLGEFPNLVVTQTLSKAYGMAAIRLGMCFASKAIIDILKKIKPPYNVNALTQQKALAEIANQGKIQGQIQEILEERQRLYEALGQVHFVEKCLPSEANFILVRVDDAPARYQQLQAKGVVVRNRSNLPLCANTLRFTVGTPSENEQLINILKQMD